jgi:hypothetical protein
MTAADGRRTRRARCWPLAAAALATLVACSADEPVGPSLVGVPETVAIGGMPGPLSDTTVPTLPAISVAAASTTTTEPEPEPEPISGPLVDAVRGHRVLLIGDTALAATTPRAGGIMCDVVTGFGWDVAIEAEPGRSLGFADEVLDELLDDDWDVVGLLFGHHVEDTVDDFERRLDGVLDRLEPQPVVLVTVAELGDQQVEVNRVLRERARDRPNVVVVDWAEAVAAEPDVLLDGGGPTPSAEGAGRLALFTAAILGQVAGDRPGTCVEPVFTDDSAIVL